MRTSSSICLIAALLACYVLLSHSSQRKKIRDEKLRSPQSHIKVKRNYTEADIKKHKLVTQGKKAKRTGSTRVSTVPGSDISCTRLGGICQLKKYVCQGRYLIDKCTGLKMQQCCMPVGAWSVFCAGQHNNRVRACDVHGCGAFNSRRGNDLHKAVDLVCDDYSVVNAPFSGSLAGPVSRTDPAGNQFDGVKLLSDVHCLKIFNIRPYRFIGPVDQGEALGYVLPLQDRFSGITSHLELRMCDGTDPSHFL